VGANARRTSEIFIVNGQQDQLRVKYFGKLRENTIIQYEKCERNRQGLA
jgi:hypothetical protein